MGHRIHEVPNHALHFPTSIPPKHHKAQVPFKEVLTNQEPLKLSKHATERLQKRNIHISEALWQKVGEKVQEARSKGVTDSLVVLNNATLLVSAKNNTVVTALDRNEVDSRIFTNINGAILMDEQAGPLEEA